MSTFAIAAAAALIVITGSVQAAEIDAMITTAMKAAIEELAPPFERAGGHTLRVSYGPSGGLARRLSGGEPADLIVVESKVLDELIKQGKVAPGRTDAARTGIGIAVPKGAPKPDVSSAEALKRALLAAKSIGHTAPAGGGVTAAHVMGVFEKLGIAADQARRRRPQRPRQRAGLERRSRDRAAAGVRADVESRGRGDRHAAGGAAADYDLFRRRDDERQASRSGEGIHSPSRRA